MRNEQTSCQFFDKRHPGCHGECEAYKKWKAEHLKKKTIEEKNEQAYRMYKVDRVRKTKHG